MRHFIVVVLRHEVGEGSGESEDFAVGIVNVFRHDKGYELLSGVKLGFTTFYPVFERRLFESLIIQLKPVYGIKRDSSVDSGGSGFPALPGWRRKYEAFGSGAI